MSFANLIRGCKMAKLILYVASRWNSEATITACKAAYIDRAEAELHYVRLVSPPAIKLY